MVEEKASEQALSLFCPASLEGPTSEARRFEASVQQCLEVLSDQRREDRKVTKAISEGIDNVISALRDPQSSTQGLHSHRMQSVFPYAIDPSRQRGELLSAYTPWALAPNRTPSSFSSHVLTTQEAGSTPSSIRSPIPDAPFPRSLYSHRHKIDFSQMPSTTAIVPKPAQYSASLTNQATLGASLLHPAYQPNRSQAWQESPWSAFFAFGASSYPMLPPTLAPFAPPAAAYPAFQPFPALPLSLRFREATAPIAPPIIPGEPWGFLPSGAHSCRCKGTR